MCAISLLDVRDLETQSAVKDVAALYSMAYALSTSTRPGFPITMTLCERAAGVGDLSRSDVAAVKAALDALSTARRLVFGDYEQQLCNGESSTCSAQHCRGAFVVRREVLASAAERA